MIPAYATAGALLYVAVLMVDGLKSIDWDDITEAAPVVIVAIMMPLTFSISNGITLGFIAYAAIKIASGKAKELTASVWFLAILFLLKLIFFPG